MSSLECHSKFYFVEVDSRMLRTGVLRQWEARGQQLLVLLVVSSKLVITLTKFLLWLSHVGWVITN